MSVSLNKIRPFFNDIVGVVMYYMNIVEDVCFSRQDSAIFPLTWNGVFMKIMTLGLCTRLDFWRFDPFGHMIKELVLSSGFAFSPKRKGTTCLAKEEVLILVLPKNLLSLDKLHDI